MIHARHMKYKLRVIAFHLISLFLFDYLKSSRQTPEVKSLSAAGVLRQFPSDPHRSIHIERGTVFGCRCREPLTTRGSDCLFQAVKQTANSSVSRSRTFDI